MLEPLDNICLKKIRISLINKLGSRLEYKICLYVVNLRTIDNKDLEGLALSVIEIIF